MARTNVTIVGIAFITLTAGCGSPTAPTVTTTAVVAPPAVPLRMVTWEFDMSAPVNFDVRISLDGAPIYVHQGLTTSFHQTTIERGEDAGPHRLTFEILDAPPGLHRFGYSWSVLAPGANLGFVADGVPRYLAAGDRLELVVSLDLFRR